MSGTANDELTAIEATIVSYLTAFNRGDASAVVAHYTQDGVLISPNGPAVEGKDALTQFYPRVFEAVDFAMNYDIKEVVQTSADWAFVRSATDGTETIKATGDVLSAQYQELFVLRKSAADGWQIARYCTSKIILTS